MSKAHFVHTDTFLDRILSHKQEELAAAMAARPLAEVRATAETAPATRDMVTALRRDTVALIAEVKHASPSKGMLIEPFEPLSLAKVYAENGAAAISVLTDERFFQGHLDDLAAVRNAVNVPVMRKEFIIAPYQVYEARAAGADALLLIVAALDDEQLADLYTLTTQLGMTALVEVHNEAELERALKLGAALIGINNRDLKTFDVDLETTGRLAALVPDGVTLVAESGLRNPADVARMGQLGAHAVLIGETLVKSDKLAETVKSLSSQKREVLP